LHERRKALPHGHSRGSLPKRITQYKHLLGRTGSLVNSSNSLQLIPPGEHKKKKGHSLPFFLSEGRRCTLAEGGLKSFQNTEALWSLYKEAETQSTSGESLARQWRRQKGSPLTSRISQRRAPTFRLTVQNETLREGCWTLWLSRGPRLA